MKPTTLISPDGISFRDLNGNGTMEPYENPTLSVEERVDDLISRLSLEEKAGLMFQTVIEAAADGSVLEGPGAISKSPTTTVVVAKLMNHFNIHELDDPRMAARWNNALQTIAETTPHGIPVTVSTDPRHAFSENAGASFTAGAFSQWPEPLGLAALDDPDAVRAFADIARQEYCSVGIRAALHPQVDLTTEPRWARQLQSFGQDADRVSAYTIAYLDGFEQNELGPDSVACVTKHFPGGGPQKDGEDAHFPYGREQVYPGGMFDYHLKPFYAAIERGTAGIMPYYGMPVGLEIDGEKVEEVGFGYNKQILTGLLRKKMGYDGVIVSDWELVNDNLVGDQVLPARAWGVEHLDPAGRLEKILDAGADQLGGEECTELLLQLVADGRVTEDRLDASARRLLRVKFQLGLFDNPFVDEDHAAATVGRADFVEAGLRAQAESVVVLKNGSLPTGEAALPMARGRKIYVEGFDHDVVGHIGEIVENPADADLALVRLHAPWEHRNDLFLEAWFHQGSLEFPPGLVVRLARIAAQVPLLVDVTLDRAAILTPIADIATALTANFGSSDKAVLDALTGAVAPRGRLPIELPRSMEAVRGSREDVPSDTLDPLFPAGFGLTI